MSEAFQPTFEYWAATVKPGVPDGTMIAEISGGRPAARPVTAVTVTRPVMSVPELVMKHLVPLITHSSPSRTAVVRVPPGVGAAAGLGEAERAEDLADAQARQPLLASARSVPKRWIGIAPSETPASSVIATEESTRASSSSARHSAR